MDLSYIKLDVFTDTPFSGNPLAVFPNAENISLELMPKIANELNLSETVFITDQLNDTDFVLKIFTPGREMDFAGHPTIGTAKVLKHMGKIDTELNLIENAGIVPIRFENQNIFLKSPIYPHAQNIEFSKESAAETLNLSSSKVIGIYNYTAGADFNFIELEHSKAVEDISFSTPAWQKYFSALECSDIHAFYLDKEAPVPSVHCRLFAPADNIPEDAATGSAAAALAGILKDIYGIKGTVHIRQGIEMGRPSLIKLFIHEDYVEVGGQAIITGSGKFEF